MSEQETLAPWHDDRLGYRELGETFTNLVTSITDTRVISIEAGFGHGKTYFRKNWAQQLRDAGEVVIEIDAMLSDHSGEPVVTFLGAMLEQIATADPSNLEKAKVAAKKMGGVVVRAGLKAVLRSGAEEIIDFAAEQSDSATLDEIIEGVGGTLSDVAAGMIDSQLATENARKRELPEQLGILRDLLTEEKEAERVIVIVDELDRCHPEYAIALLEAMKVVFNLDGFVFCLMMNADYLERIADRRFGAVSEGERYLDKFVDMRLRLRPNEDEKQIAVENLILALPSVSVPFSSDEEFGKTRAIEVAKTFVSLEHFTMRQLEKVMQRLELAIRMYTTQPIDLPLLVYLAFLSVLEKNVEEMDEREAQITVKRYGLERARLMPNYVKALYSRIPDGIGNKKKKFDSIARLEHFLRESMPEMFSTEILGGYKVEYGKDYFNLYALLDLLAPNYIPSHIQMLNAALAISADN